MIDRVRTTDQVRPARVSGVQYLPSATLVYQCGPDNYLGFKKTIVDKIASKIAKPYRVRGAAHSGSGTVTKRSITDVKPVRIQSFKGWANMPTFDTRGCLPRGWSDYVMSGPWANALLWMEPMPHTLKDGYFWGNLVSPPLADTSAVQWCLQKAYSERAQPDGELSVALAELPQLIGLLRSPFHAISKAARKWQSLWCGDAWVFNPEKGLVSLRTKRKYPGRKVSRSFLDEASNRWLELQYGLLPSIGDAEIAITAINEKLDVIREIMYGKSKFTAYNSKKVYRDLYGQVGPTFFVRGSAKYTGKVQYTSKCYYRYLTVPTYISRLGFDPKDLWNILWELTPWSFVVDWLWDVGGMLHTLAYDSSLINLGNYVSVKYDEKLWLQVDRIEHYGYKGKLSRVPVQQLHQEQLLRQVNLEMPSFPQFNVKWFNITRSFNALSLLWQQLPR